VKGKNCSQTKCCKKSIREGKVLANSCYNRRKRCKKVLKRFCISKKKHGCSLKKCCVKQIFNCKSKLLRKTCVIKKSCIGKLKRCSYKKTKNGCFRKVCCTRRKIGGKLVKNCHKMKSFCPLKVRVKCRWVNQKNKCKKQTCCKTVIRKNQIISKNCRKIRSFCPVFTKKTCKRIHFKKSLFKKNLLS